MQHDPDVTAQNDARLVTMANQIATFFASQPMVVPGDAVAAHLNDFWTPPMRARLLELIAAGGTGLRAEAIAAEPLIRRPGAPRVPVTGVEIGVPPTRKGEEGAPADPARQSSAQGADG